MSRWTQPSSVPAATRDEIARESSLSEAREVMQAADALAALMRRRWGGKKVQTYHRGLAGSFTIHRYGGEGLHISVRARMTLEEGVKYRIDVAGNGELTEREVKRIVKLLMTDHMARFPREEKSDGE